MNINYLITVAARVRLSHLEAMPPYLVCVCVCAYRISVIGYRSSFKRYRRQTRHFFFTFGFFHTPRKTDNAPPGHVFVVIHLYL